MNKATKQLSRLLAIIVIITFVVTSAIPAEAISVSPDSVSARVGSSVSEKTKSTPTKFFDKVKETTKKVFNTSKKTQSSEIKTNSIGESAESIANRLLENSRLDLKMEAKIRMALEQGNLNIEMLKQAEKSLNDNVGAPNFANVQRELASKTKIGDQSFSGASGYDAMFGGKRSYYEGFEDWRISDIEVYDSNFIVVTGSYKHGEESRVAIFDGEKWDHYTLPLPYVGANMTITSKTFSRDDIYVGGYAGLIYHYDGTNWEIQNYFEDRGYNVRRFMEASDGNLYAIADTAGLWKQNADKETWSLVDFSASLPVSSFAWDAQEYNGKIYFINDNNVGTIALASYDLVSHEVLVLVGSIDPQQDRGIHGIFVDSPSSIYLTSSVFNNGQENGTAMVFKYNGVGISRIVGQHPESDSLPILQDIKKDPISGDIWVAGEYGTLGTLDPDTDTLTIEPIDFNADGTRDRDDWYLIPAFSTRISEIYITAMFLFEEYSSVIKFGTADVPQISFENLKSVYHSGDQVNISLKIDNSEGNYEELDVYIALEIPGDPNLYYFWPSWSDSIGKKNTSLDSGVIASESVLNLTLPDNLPSAGPFNLYAVLTAPGNFSLFSNVATGQLRLEP